MKHTLDYSETNEAGNFDPAPEGIYRLKIVEHEDGETQTGRAKVMPKCKVVNECPHKGKVIKHTVTIIPGGEPGAGFLKHFLRVIGQPFEGRFQLNSDRWDNAEFMARVSIEDREKNGTTYHNNVIAESWKSDDPDVPSCGAVEAAPKSAKEKLKDMQATKRPDADDSDVPF